MSFAVEHISDRQKLQRLLQFDLWCSRKLNSIIRTGVECDQTPACRAFLSHIINVQKKWYGRVTGEDSNPVYLWEDIDPADLNTVARKIHGKWMDLVADHEVDLETLIYWTNDKGVEYAGTLHQICNHLIIHGQYHRAQIALLLIKCGSEAPEIDYYHYTVAGSTLFSQ